MDVANLLELDPRPMGLVLSAVCPMIIANDIFEMGGELESYLQASVTGYRLCGPTAPVSLIDRSLQTSGISSPRQSSHGEEEGAQERAHGRRFSGLCGGSRVAKALELQPS